MSLLSSLFTGVSGLQTYGNAMQVIGSNIANVNTIGFKGGRSEFSALFSDAVGTGQTGLGRGIKLKGISTSFSQGSLSSTDRSTDLAIDGRGFFVLSDGQSQIFTRDGQFSINSAGSLVSSLGLRVQGTLFDNQGQPTGQGDLQIATFTSPPQATTDGIAGSGVGIVANLDARTTSPGAFDDTSSSTAESTSNISTTISVFDSLGNAHTMTIYFRNNGSTVENQWEWFAAVDGADTGGTPGQLTIGGQGTITFDTNGTITAQGTPTATFSFAGGASASQVIGLDFTGTTQFGSPSVVNFQTQDGFTSGDLSSIQIGADGVITGFFSNGENTPLGQLDLASFTNEGGLVPLANNLFTASAASGLPVIGNPTAGGLGSISSFTLELSNVDLANEFVNLVTTQRAYQANTRIITTVDQLLNDVVNLIR